MKLNQIKIGLRLNLAFAALLGLMVSVALVAFVQLETIRDGQAVSAEQERHAELANRWRHLTALNLARSQALLLSKGNAELSKHFAPDIKATTEQINAIQKELAIAVTANQGKSLLAQIAVQRSAYIAVREEAFKLDPAATGEALTSKVQPVAQTYVAAIDALADQQRGLVAERASITSSSIRQSEWTMLCLVLGAIGACGWLTWRITKSVTAPIGRVIQATQTIAAGDLSASLEVEGSDEISQLQRGLAGMQQSLRQLVGDIRNSTNSISTASTEIATGNVDLGQRTEQTASNLQQATSSMDQLTTNVKHSADSARQANQLASSAAQVAARGGEVVSQVVSTMDEINASSKKISDIIGVIDGIAFRPTSWPSTPPSKRPVPASRAAALPWWPAKCAAWQAARPKLPKKSKASSAPVSSVSRLGHAWCKMPAPPCKKSSPPYSACPTSLARSARQLPSKATASVKSTPRW